MYLGIHMHQNLIFGTVCFEQVLNLQTIENWGVIQSITVLLFYMGFTESNCNLIAHGRRVELCKFACTACTMMGDDAGGSGGLIFLHFTTSLKLGFCGKPNWAQRLNGNISHNFQCILS